MADKNEAPKEKAHQKKLTRKPLFWIAVLLFLYMFIGFVIAPLIVESQIIDFIEEEYNRKSSMESVSINPFTLSATINGFILNEKDESIFMQWEEFYVNISLIPLISKEINIEEMELNNASITAIKRRDDFNFSDLSKQVEEEEQAVESLIILDWIINVDEFYVNDFNVNFYDRSFEPAAEVHIDSIDVSVTGLRLVTPDTTNFVVSFKIREGGNGSVKGMFTQIPLLAELSLDVDSVSIIPGQPYLSQLAHLRIDGGEGHLAGDVKFEMSEEMIPYATFTGEMGMSNLDLFDNLREERLLSWSSVDNYGVNITYQPISLEIDSIVVDGFYARAAVDENQNINALEVFEPVLGPIDVTNIDLDTVKVEKSDIEYTIEIGDISIVKSGMYFSDFSLPINFSAKVHDLNGHILGISTGNPLGAIVALSGEVDDYGYAKIEGNLDPFNPLDYSSMEMNFQNIDLTQMDGYSGKFVGYKIDKGAINLDLEYEIRKGLLSSNNQIFMSQLSLGDEVESEESLGPIVKLAIALLKDSDGNIDMDIEIEGDLNDPEINTGKLVWWAVKRSLTTIVTAPFRFLGGILGINNSEELEFIEFEVADSTLSPPQIEKLQNIAKALNERPGLKLGIWGAVDTVADKYAMQKIKFDSSHTNRLKEESGQQNITTTSADQGLRREVLETMFVEEHNDSLLNLLVSDHIEKENSENEATVVTADNVEDHEILSMRDYFNELTEQLVETQKITREEYVSLTSQRGQTIYNYLTVNLNVSKDRLDLKGNEIHEYEDDDWVRCRLELEPME